MNTPLSFCHVTLTVALKTPWLVHGNDPGRFGLDAALLRDHTNKPILPGSLVVGRIIDGWQALREMGIDMPDAREWFGTVPDSEASAGRARLFVDDLVASVAERMEMATRIVIDSDTQAATSGMLMMVEQIDSIGAEIVFEGTWRAWLSESEQKNLPGHLQAGLAWHSQLGALRSIGFGELASVKVNVQPIEEQRPSLDALADQQEARIALRFDRPLCVGSMNKRGNVFESDDVITGGSLIGALATMLGRKYGVPVARLKAVSKLAAHFDAIRITHALPSASTSKRPAAIPLSLAAVDSDAVFDVASIKEPHLIAVSDPERAMAPAFLHDWKGHVWTKVNSHRQWGETARYLRVRTAIDAKSRTAKEDNLFAYECVVPLANTTWQALIDLSRIPHEDRPQVWQELSALLANGLGPIGKTDAWATVSLNQRQPDDTVWPQHPVSGNTLVLQLMTDALLFPSSVVADKQPDLHSLYSDVFSALSEGALKLSHFYASQHMAGGEYLWNRYGKRRSGTYQPYVLTSAGSVFVLSFDESERQQVQTCIRNWQQQGLPLPPAVVDAYGSNWDDHPYLPQNGYGEIAINLEHGFQAPSLLVKC
jgi:hypothetical protein